MAHVRFGWHACAVFRSPGLLLLVSCLFLARLVLAGEPVQELDSLTGEELAKLVCQTCHIRPEPSVLDKTTWEKYLLPWMSTKLGLKKVDFDKLPGGQIVRQAQIIPESPFLTINQWKKICDYYVTAAPEAPIPQGPRPAIQLDLENQFTVTAAPYRASPPMTTLIKITSGGRVFVGDSLRRSLCLLNGGGQEINRFNAGNPPVSIDARAEGLYLTLIGYVAPSDDPIGRVLFIPQSAQGFEKPVVLLDHLARPCDTRIVDLNGDGREDLLVCQYGNMLGRLSWHEKLTNGLYAEHVLREQPGALYSDVRDFNKDGRPDIIALMAQAQEGIYLFLNEGNGQFGETPLLQEPPVWGFTWFELADFNRDGYPDLLVTNGDNAEYPAPMKNYHGVRIYLNDGANHFQEAMFFPLNGAYKAVARDFDGDGDLDIAAISFFPDYIRSPEESFVFLRNEGNLRFSAHSFPDAASGRWIVMDAGDVDGDGLEDIVLGAFNRGPQTIPLPPAIRDRWQTGPGVLILRNRGLRK